MRPGHALRRAAAGLFAVAVLSVSSTGVAQAGDLPRGARLYEAWCMDCHGAARTPTNPTSLNARHSVPVLREGIANARSGMLFLGDVLSAQDLSDIVAYLGTTPVSVDFGSVAADAPSAVRTVELMAGRDGLDALVATVQGDFVRAGGSCGRSLPALQTCTIEVAFRPQGAGERQGVLRLAHSGLSATVDLPLTAVAAPPAGAVPSALLALDVDRLDFGRQTVGQVSAARTIVATNRGTVPLAWLSRIPPTGFTVSDDCGASLAPQAQCRLTVRFAPVSPGPATGDLVLVTSHAGGTVRLPLAGEAVAAAPRLRWEPAAAAVDFGPATVGRSAGTPALALRNDGPGPARLDAVRIGGPQAGDFVVADDATCRAGRVLDAGAACALPLVFTPRATGERRAALAIATDGEAPAELALAGSGTAPPPPTAATNVGGGGCTIAGGRGLADPLWLALVAGAVGVLVARRRSARDCSTRSRIGPAGREAR